MATAFLVGVGALAAGVLGRQIYRSSFQRASQEFLKGGFRSKMDRKEAIAILGLKCVLSLTILSYIVH